MKTLVVLSLFILAFASIIAQEGAGTSDPHVKVSAVGTEPDKSGKQIVTITLLLDKGWQCWANPCGVEMEGMKSLETEVSFASKIKPIFAKIAYPAGTVIDSVIGKYNVYEQKVEINAVVWRAKDDPGPLEACVRYTSKHEITGHCQIPRTVKVFVAVK